MKLEMARHPCLEVQDDVAFIANDITLERSMKKSKVASVFFPSTVFLLFPVSICGLVLSDTVKYFLFCSCFFVYIFVYIGRRQGIFDHHWTKHGRQVHLHQTGLLGRTVKVSNIVFILFLFIFMFVLLLSERRRT